jgi:hypothetical protein
MPRCQANVLSTPHNERHLVSGISAIGKDALHERGQSARPSEAAREVCLDTNQQTKS